MESTQGNLIMHCTEEMLEKSDYYEMTVFSILGEKGTANAWGQERSWI